MIPGVFELKAAAAQVTASGGARVVAADVRVTALRLGSVVVEFAPGRGQPLVPPYSLHASIHI